MTATPTDIPADIFATARAVFASISTVDWVEAEIIIARSILAERMRCAQIADELAELSREAVAEFVAHAIRNPIPNSARGFSSAERRVETAPPSPSGTPLTGDI